jgi:hypothetical protein
MFNPTDGVGKIVNDLQGMNRVQGTCFYYHAQQLLRFQVPQIALKLQPAHPDRLML